MRSLSMLFALICAAVLQAVIPTWHWLGQANAPVLLGVVLYYSLSQSRFMMFQSAILAGLLQDALGLIPLGYSSFCFVLAGVFVAKFKDIVFVHESITHMLFGGLAAGFVTLVLYGLLAQGDLILLRPAWAVLKTIGSVILGAIVVPLEFELLESLDRMLGNVEPRET